MTDKLILPDPGEYAMVAMRYKGTELAFCMKPDDMAFGFTVTVEKLRELVMCPETMMVDFSVPNDILERVKVR